MEDMTLYHKVNLFHHKECPLGNQYVLIKDIKEEIDFGNDFSYKKWYPDHWPDRSRYGMDHERYLQNTGYGWYQ